MLRSLVLFVVGVGSLLAALLWGRSAMRLVRSHQNIVQFLLRHEGEGSDRGRESLMVARSAYLKSFHLTFLYLAAGSACIAASLLPARWAAWPFAALGVMVAVTFGAGGRLMREPRLIEARATLEHRAEQVLSQQQLAPMRWSERLAPEKLPAVEGFEIAHYYQAGAGAMAGDFYDVFPVSPGRLVVAVGDVTGHGVDPSITAFQVKNLLRVYVRQYRDPGQAMEELNATVTAQGMAGGRSEEMVSVCLVVFDQLPGTIRFSSAGHPPAWLLHEGGLRSLRATGPILGLDPKASYFSREIVMSDGDVLLLYTDGLVEARSGEELFGEDRVAAALARDPRQSMEALCKGLVDAAQDFAGGPFFDDVAVLAIRCGKAAER